MLIDYAGQNEQKGRTVGSLDLLEFDSVHCIFICRLWSRHCV